MERDYVPEDHLQLMDLRKVDLLALVEAQRSRWPYPSLSRNTSKKELCSELLNPSNGFTTTMPLPTISAKSESTGFPLVPPIIAGPTAPSTPTSSLAVSEATISPAMLIAQTPQDHFGLTLTSGAERSITVFIFDFRSYPPSKTVQRIEVVVVDTITCMPGEWRADAMQVFQQIQVSNAIITGGLVKIGVPFEGDPQFTTWFLRGHLQFLSSATPEPDRLKVYSDSTLILRVDEGVPYESPPPLLDHLYDHSPLSKKPRLLPPNSSPPPSPSPLRRLPTASSSRSQITPMSSTEADLAWLQGVVELRPGYKDFVARHGKILQNAEIVLQWKFAAEFSKEYHRHPTPSGNNIKKSLIWRVLGIKETWLSQAEDGARLIAIFGAGGSHAADSVMSEVATLRRPASGSVKLLKFLQDWSRAHPIH